MDAIYKERILQLTDHLDSISEAQFEMNRWLSVDTEMDTDDDCNTIACIAGHAVLLLYDRGTPDDPIDLPSNIFGAARELLGLTSEQAASLFVPEQGRDIGWGVAYDSITTEFAADTLRELAETERVNWNLAVGPV